MILSSSIVSFELFHECNQLFYAFDRHSVVNGCTHTANGAVTLQIHKAGSSCLLDELCVHILIAGHERHIHQRAVFLADSTLEQLALVQESYSTFALAMLRFCISSRPPIFLSHLNTLPQM